MIAEKNKNQTKWTYQDYLTITNEIRYEIVNGDLIMAPSPSSKHQTVSKRIEFLLYLLEEKGIGYVFNAPLDVVFADDVVLQPDLFFILENNQKIIQEKAIMGVPDVIFEIISNSTAQIDRDKKYHIYMKHEVKEYWIIDPLWNSIDVFILNKENYQLHCSVQGEAKVTSTVIPGFELDIAEIIR